MEKCKEPVKQGRGEPLQLSTREAPLATPHPPPNNHGVVAAGPMKGAVYFTRQVCGGVGRRLWGARTLKRCLRAWVAQIRQTINVV